MEDAPEVLKLLEVRMSGHMGPSTTMHVATDLAEYSRASGPYLYNRFHESFRPNKAFGLVVVTAALWRRARLCQTSAKTLQSTNGTVLTDKESDIFPIKRETKQGDPLSSLLFNTVLQNSLEEDLKRWQEKQRGIRLSDKKEDCLTNLRFADDVLLFSTSLEKLREMLCEFKISTEAVGLGIHPDKTKILSNQEINKKKDRKSRSRSKKQKKSKTD